MERANLIVPAFLEKLSANVFPAFEELAQPGFNSIRSLNSP
jgi:hypothetical protein